MRTDEATAGSATRRAYVHGRNIVSFSIHPFFDKGHCSSLNSLLSLPQGTEFRIPLFANFHVWLLFLCESPAHHHPSSPPDFSSSPAPIHRFQRQEGILTAVVPAVRARLAAAKPADRESMVKRVQGKVRMKGSDERRKKGREPVALGALRLVHRPALVLASKRPWAKIQSSRRPGFVLGCIIRSDFQLHRTIQFSISDFAFGFFSSCFVLWSVDLGSISGNRRRPSSLAHFSDRR